MPLLFAPVFLHLRSKLDAKGLDARHFKLRGALAAADHLAREGPTRQRHRTRTLRTLATDRNRRRHLKLLCS
jgi:hypothetical protein